MLARDWYYNERRQIGLDSAVASIYDCDDDRDLRVATDSRAILKGILRDHLGLDAAALGATVFPDTATLAPVTCLVHT